MGQSIDIHMCDRNDLARAILNFVEKNGGYRIDCLVADDFLTTVGPKFGTLTNDKFYVLWNELYDNYNPASQFLRAVERYYFPHSEDLDFWYSGYGYGVSGAECSEVLADVFPDEFGDEGKFVEGEF